MAENKPTPPTVPATKAPVAAPAVPAAKAPEKKIVNPLAEDSWLYHKDFEPKLFLKGEETPGPDWSSSNKHGWIKDLQNNFHWRKK